jgi:hypothetical protein
VIEDFNEDRHFYILLVLWAAEDLMDPEPHADPDPEVKVVER